MNKTKTQYKMWSEMERQRLLYFVSHNKSNTVIRWNNYQNDVPGKSVKQVKSYYNNILRHEHTNTHNYFTEDEMLDMLFHYVIERYTIE